MYLYKYLYNIIFSQHPKCIIFEKNWILKLGVSEYNTLNNPNTQRILYGQTIKSCLRAVFSEVKFEFTENTINGKSMFGFGFLFTFICITFSFVHIYFLNVYLMSLFSSINLIGTYYKIYYSQCTRTVTSLYNFYKLKAHT